MKNKNGMCYQKSVQDFSKFNVGVFLNDDNANFGKLRMSVGMSFRVCLVAQYVFMFQLKF